MAARGPADGRGMDLDDDDIDELRRGPPQRLHAAGMSAAAATRRHPATAPAHIGSSLMLQGRRAGPRAERL